MFIQRRKFNRLSAVAVIAAAVGTPVTASAGHGQTHQDSGPAAGHSGGDHGKSAHDAATAFGRPGNPFDVRRFVFLKATDIKFNKTTIRIRKGQTVKFVITNKGEQDHEMTIGDATTQKAHRAQMAKAQERGASMKGHGHGNAVYLKPGRTKTLIWKFDRLGAFEFACNIPGHYEAGMKGKIIVTE